MSKIAWVWLVLALVYATFFSWYTSFEGPLTDEEIEHYLAVFAQNGSSAERLASMRLFMEQDSGDDFAMLNVIDMYDQPLAVEGVQPGESSVEVLDKYMAYMYPALFARASHPVMFGTAAHPALELINAPGMEQWTTGALMRYRSRRDLLDISSNPAFQGSHNFKVAALEKTIAFPLDPWMQLGDPRLVLALLLALLGTMLSWRMTARGN